MLRLDADCEIKRILVLILAVIDLDAVRPHSSAPISEQLQLITTRLRVAGPTTTAADARVVLLQPISQVCNLCPVRNNLLQLWSLVEY